MLNLILRVGRRERLGGLDSVDGDTARWDVRLAKPRRRFDQIAGGISVGAERSKSGILIVRCGRVQSRQGSWWARVDRELTDAGPNVIVGPATGGASYSPCR